MHQEISGCSPHWEYLERKPQSVCHRVSENLPSTLGKKALQEIPKGSVVTTGVRTAAARSQPHHDASVTPPDSGGLLLAGWCLLSSTIITPDHPLFWVNGRNPSHWQDKMTCAETGGRTFQTLSFTRCICVNDSNHLYTVGSANNSSSSRHTVANPRLLCVWRERLVQQPGQSWLAGFTGQRGERGCNIFHLLKAKCHTTRSLLNCRYYFV